MKNMIKNNIWKLIFSSLLILLPILVGFILWDRLPDQLVIHWGINGADAWMSTLHAVLFLPLLLLAIHWLCLWITAKDYTKAEQSKKILNLTFWIVPIISLFACGTMYAAAFGVTDVLPAVTAILFGSIFVVMGNLIPKARRNPHLGLKIKWTLGNDDNWNKTHRFAGKLMFFGGFFCFPCAFLPIECLFFVLIPLIFIIVLLPTLYSYIYYRKQLKEGTATKENYDSALPPNYKKIRLIVIPLIVVILSGIAVITFTGNIAPKYDENTFTLEVTYWDDPTFSYSDIEDIEYREDVKVGERVNGFNSARLLLGYFRNEEFGNYTRFSYTGCDACVVMKVKGSTVVISMNDEESTKAFYEELLEKIK